MYRQSRRDPKEHCIEYMKMGWRTITTLHSIAQETPEILVKKKVVLQQLLHSCIDALLDRLVGPKCTSLKLNRSDWEKYSFRPVELLRMVVEMYI